MCVTPRACVFAHARLCEYLCVHVLMHVYVCILAWACLGVTVYTDACVLICQYISAGISVHAWRRMWSVCVCMLASMSVVPCSVVYVRMYLCSRVCMDGSECETIGMRV